MSTDKDAYTVNRAWLILYFLWVILYSLCCRLRKVLHAFHVFFFTSMSFFIDVFCYSLFLYYLHKVHSFIRYFIAANVKTHLFYNNTDIYCIHTYIHTYIYSYHIRQWMAMMRLLESSRFVTYFMRRCPVTLATPTKIIFFLEQLRTCLNKKCFCWNTWQNDDI